MMDSKFILHYPGGPSGIHCNHIHPCKRTAVRLTIEEEKAWHPWKGLEWHGCKSKNPSRHQKLGKARNDSPQEPADAISPVNTLILALQVSFQTFLFQVCKRANVSDYKSVVMRFSSSKKLISIPLTFSRTSSSLHIIQDPVQMAFPKREFPQRKDSLPRSLRCQNGFSFSKTFLKVRG